MVPSSASRGRVLAALDLSATAGTPDLHPRAVSLTGTPRGPFRFDQLAWCCRELPHRRYDRRGRQAGKQDGQDLRHTSATTSGSGAAV